MTLNQHDKPRSMHTHTWGGHKEAFESRHTLPSLINIRVMAEACILKSEMHEAEMSGSSFASESERPSSSYQMFELMGNQF